MAQIKITSRFNPSPYPYIMANGRPKRGNYCRACGRPLKDAESIARGYGPECWQSIPVLIVLDIQAVEQGVHPTGGNVCQFCGLPCGDKPYHLLCDPATSG